MFVRYLFLSALCAALSLSGAEPTPTELLSAIRGKLAPSLVTVNYRLKLDANGVPPSAAGLLCSSCDSFHGRETAPYFADGRAYATVGFLVTPDTVLAPDVMLMPEDYTAITVDFDGQTVPATLTDYYFDNGGVRLKLAKPLAGSAPLRFVPDASGKLYRFSSMDENGVPVDSLLPFAAAGTTMIVPGRRLSRSVPPNVVIVNAAGEVAALFLNNNEVMGDTPWNQAWQQWPSQSAAVFAQRLAELTARVPQGVFPVRLHFSAQAVSRRERLRGNDGGGNELDTFGIVLAKDELLIPMLLSPLATARLERIAITDGKQELTAEFLGSLRQFGAIIARAPKGFSGKPLATEAPGLFDELGAVTLAVRVRAYPQSLELKYASDMLINVQRQFRSRSFALTQKSGPPPNLLFTPDGRLLAVGLLGRAFNYRQTLTLLSAAELLSELRTPERFDRHNVPRARGLADAWLGVEYQPLTPELALVKNISRQTDNGRVGLLVTAVYQSSPAATLGLASGDVLLRIGLPDHGLPIYLTAKDFKPEAVEQFPWDRLDRIPERFFDDIPEPWPPLARDPLSRLLSNIGIGNAARLVVLHDGKLQEYPFVVAAAPESFETVPALKLETLGITVCPLTPEVRRYFGFSADETGVIVSKVRPGSPAATSGLRPYEIITAVNDRRLDAPSGLAQACAAADQLRLSVRRLARSRVITVKLPVGPVK